VTMRKQTAVSSEERSQRIYQCLFRPRTIAIIGASGDPLKPGGRVLKNILEYGYNGILRPVNPKTAEILGIPVCSSIAALPETPDLAIVAIPSAMVPAAVAELADLGTWATIILTRALAKRTLQAKRLRRR